MLVATFQGPTPVANTSITATQIPVSSTSIAVTAARFTPIPVSNTFIPVTQRGDRGGNRMASNIVKLPHYLAANPESIHRSLTVYTDSSGRRYAVFPHYGCARDHSKLPLGDR